jgi:hypothetical protein
MKKRVGTMKHTMTFLLFCLISTGNALEKKSSKVALFGKSKSCSFVALLAKDFDFTKAIKKTWTTNNSDGTHTVWYKDIENTVYRINNDGIKELYKKQ